MAPTVMSCPSRSRRQIASMARLRAASVRARAAWARWAVLSARIVVAVVVEGFEGGDDGVEAVLDAAHVGDQPEAPVGFGAGDQGPVGGRLGSVHGQELGGGLKVGTGQAGVGVRAVALGRPTAVAVREAVG